MKRFLPYFALLKPVRLAFLAALLTGVLFGASSGLGLPLVTHWALPRIFTEEATPTLAQILLTISVIPLMFVVRSLTGFANTILITYCGTRVLEQLRLRVFEKLQSLPYAAIQQRPLGDTLSRLMGDAAALQGVITGVSNGLIKEPIKLLAAVGAVFYLAFQDPALIRVLLALAVIPISVLPVRWVGKHLLHRAKQLQDRSGNISSVVVENLRAAKDVRLYNLQGSETGRFGKLQAEILRLAIKVARYREGLSPMIEVLGSIGVALAIALAATSGLGLDEVVPLIVALYLSYEPLKRFGMISNQLKQGEASLIRLEDILHEPDRISDPEHPQPLERARGEISFREVSFGYSDVPVLKNVHLTIAPGETVALVGPSGAGKTTFANLVPRLYEVTSGAVEVDGTDVRSYRLADLRAQVAMVSQDPYLFGASVADNIGLGRPGATQADIEEAARRAYAHDFIHSLAEGYATVCGEGGSRFSGGQRQRIAIARAFLKDAPILILDEPTSALDAESEEQIQVALRDLVQGRTTLVVSHRFALIRFARRVLLFRDGVIEADGSFDELLEKNRLFRSLYEASRAESEGAA